MLILDPYIIAKVRMQAKSKLNTFRLLKQVYESQGVLVLV
jgi:hypothetical protein